MEAARGRIDIGRVIGETFSTYGAQAGVLLGAAVAVFVVVGLIQGLLATSGEFLLVLLGGVVSVVGTTLYTGFVVKLVEDVRDGKRDFTVGELFSAAAGVVGVLLLNGILKAIAVTIGFILVIVPGLILLTIWAVTAPAIVVERRGVIDAFGRSLELVRGQGWAVFAVIVIVFLITAGIGWILGALGNSVGDAGAIIFPVVGAIVTAPVSALASSILFFDLGGGAVRAAPPTEAAPPPPPATPAA
jgi:hypothetical protein